MTWKSMKTAPKDREIVVRRHNDVFHEYVVVFWYQNDLEYPWHSLDNSYPEGRWDEWNELPE